MSANELDPPVVPSALAEFQEGVRLQRAGNLSGALTHLQNALRLSGTEHPGILELLAAVAGDGGDLPAAEKILRRVLQLRPGIGAAFRLAIVLFKQRRYAEAVTWFERTLPHLVYNPDAEEAFAYSLERAGEYDRSLAVYDQVMARAPSAARAATWASALARHGEHTRLARELPSLVEQYPDEAGLLELQCTNAFGLGDYPKGFALMRRCNEAMNQGGNNTHVPACPVWDGRRFDGTLLVSLERHAGEEIMVSPILDRIVALAQPAVVEVDARLLSLFGRTWPSLVFVERQAGAMAARVVPGQAFRRTTSLDLMQLYCRERTFPGAPGWLRTDPVRVREKRDEYRARWPGKKLVGISWRSARLFSGTDAKSVPLANLQQTLALPDTAFISLQYGNAQAEIDRAVAAPWVDPAVNATTDFEALATQIAALDLVITVSNITAHLSGALGVPTTVLLPHRFPMLWHWGFAGEETSWYGSIRLLRNPQDIGWSDLDGLLAADLTGPGRYAGPSSRPTALTA